MKWNFPLCTHIICLKMIAFQVHYDSRILSAAIRERYLPCVRMRAAGLNDWCVCVSQSDNFKQNDLAFNFGDFI